MTIQITSKSIPKPLHIILTGVATMHAKKQEHEVHFVSWLLSVGSEAVYKEQKVYIFV
jgi:hypothetical protein